MRHLAVRPALLFLAAVVLGPAAPPARAQDAPTITVNQLETSGYPSLRVVLTVLDANGVPAPGLTAGQFQAFDGEQELPIASVQQAQDASLPLGVVLAIDVSGSMAGDALVQAQQAATDFVQQLGAGDQAAIIVFNDGVSAPVPFTSDRIALTNGIATLQAAGGTALFEAVQASAFAARSEQTPRRAVVLLTDGENETNQSTATADGSIAVAKGAGVPVFTVGLGSQPDPTYLQALATATGGEYLPAATQNLTSVYGTIATLLRNQYVLTLTASAPADGAPAALRVTAEVEGSTGQATAAFQRGAAPAPPTQAVLPTPAPAGASKGGSGGTVLAVLGALAGVAAAGGLGFAAFAWVRRRRVRAHQLAVTAPNPVLAAAQPLPRPSGPVRAPAGEPALQAGTGRLVEKSAEGDRVHLLGAGPVVIGSARRLCTIILPESDDVAPEHLRIWLGEGRYLLHHSGGMRRRTLVNGREADWVRLEPGDELQVGPHRFVFEEGG